MLNLMIHLFFSQWGLLQVAGYDRKHRPHEILAKDKSDPSDALTLKWLFWTQTRDQLIVAAAKRDYLCSYIPALWNENPQFLDEIRAEAKQYIKVAKMLQYHYDEIHSPLREAALMKSPSWDIAAYHDAEMDIVRKNIFDHMTGMCSHIFSNEEFNQYAKELNAHVTQEDIRAQFTVGAEWGLEVDVKTGEVLEVMDDSPGKMAGIREGDFIIGIDDREMTYREFQWLLHVMYEYRPFEQFPFKGVINFRRTVWDKSEQNLLSRLREG